MFGRHLFRHLRVMVMIAWVVAWNATLLLGMWVGGVGLSYHSTASRIALLIALFGTTAFALGVAYSTKVQAWALRSREAVPGLRRDLWFIALLTSVGFVATAWSFNGASA
jgi:hypothetical protein